MADYKEMYLHLFRQTERAIRILQQAQLDCEELFINTAGDEMEEEPLETIEEAKGA